MATLDDLEQGLADASSSLSNAAGLSDALGSDHSGKFKRKLADALVRISEARDFIYATRPDLKPRLLRESEADPEASSAYLAARAEAIRLAASGDTEGAIAVLERFVEDTSSEFFASEARSRIVGYGGTI